MTQKWQAGKTYAPGSLVLPTAKPAANLGVLVNPGFETGDLTGWTQSSGSWSVSATEAYEGTHSAQLASGEGRLTTQGYTVKPGQSITANVQVLLVNAGTDDGDGVIALIWQDAGGNVLGSPVIGGHIRGQGGNYRTSSVSGVAPANAAKVFVELHGTCPSGGQIFFDALSWNYAQSLPPPGLVYKATQAAPGKSASTEPTWPGTLGVSVTDNEVTWEGVLASQLVWEAIPIAKSGATEPTWPQAVDAVVKDGTATMTTTTPVIADSKCPHSVAVAIAEEKVFAIDEDITRFSATGNPLDWSSANDAGFISHGLKSVQEPLGTALGLYRGNLAIFTASCLQLYKADPDPAAIVILDTVESVGTLYPRGTLPWAQDLAFISPQGIRTVSVSAAQQALGEGDIGNPMDPVVAALIGPDVTPLAAFFPNLGQSLFFFGNQVVVLFQHKLAKLTGWALYTLPITVTDVALLDGDLYVRDATDVYWFNAGSKADYGNAFDVVLEWQFLDFGTPGTTKTFHGISCDADAVCTVSAGYDVKVPTRRTGKKRLANASEAFLSFSFVAKAASFKVEMKSTAMDRFTRLNVYFKDGGAL